MGRGICPLAPKLIIIKERNKLYNLLRSLIF